MTQKLSAMLDELAAKIQSYDKTNPKVTETSVGWHLEHTFLVLCNIIKAIEASDPKQYKWGFSVPRLLVWLKGAIPRGRAKAPKQVQPNPEHIQPESLQQRLQEAREQVAKLPNLDPKKHFAHPVFKTLDVKNTVWFLELHTKHHLQIMNEVLG